MKELIRLFRKYFCRDVIFYAKLARGNDIHTKVTCIRDGKTGNIDFVEWLIEFQKEVPNSKSFIVEEFKIIR